MSDFQPIFDYIDQHIEEKIEKLEAEMATKSDIQRILNAIDAFAKESKGKSQEVKVLASKSERIEHWVIDAAKKIELPYNP